MLFRQYLVFISFLIKEKKKKATKKSPNLLVFVKHTERVQKGEVGSYTFKVFLRNIAIMIMIIVPKDRLGKKKRNYCPNI